MLVVEAFDKTGGEFLRGVEFDMPTALGKQEEKMPSLPKLAPMHNDVGGTWKAEDALEVGFVIAVSVTAEPHQTKEVRESHQENAGNQ